MRTREPFHITHKLRAVVLATQYRGPNIPPACSTTEGWNMDLINGIVAATIVLLIAMMVSFVRE
jgi:hypothetical protein